MGFIGSTCTAMPCARCRTRTPCQSLRRTRTALSSSPCARSRPCSRAWHKLFATSSNVFRTLVSLRQMTSHHVVSKYLPAGRRESRKDNGEWRVERGMRWDRGECREERGERREESRVEGRMMREARGKRRVVRQKRRMEAVPCSCSGWRGGGAAWCSCGPGCSRRAGRAAWGSTARSQSPGRTR